MLDAPARIGETGLRPPRASVKDTTDDTIGDTGVATIDLQSQAKAKRASPAMFAYDRRHAV